MHQSDGVAIEQVIAGDGEQFKVLVERYSHSLFRLAYRMTGSESDAEDVVQETFLRAYKAISTYDGRAGFSTWLFRIATNYTLDLLGKNRRSVRQSPVGDGDSDLQWDPPASSPGPDRLAESRQLQHRLRVALRQLSPQERTAFALRHFEDLSIEEIGETLGLGPSATKNSIFRGVQKLRRALSPFMRSES